MDGNPTQPRKAQLDKEEREHLEDIVTEMRDRVEANVRYQLENEYNLNEKPDADASLSEKQEDLIEAIELEIADEDNWEAAHEQYITGVGYTIVNRLAALRCMEVRGFIDDEVTVFREDGLTPAADRLVTEEFMLEEEAVLEAYRNECDNLAEEIDILFNRSTVYSLIDPDDDTFEDLCGMLDQVSDEVWRADDVLGWVYEYYNRPIVEALDAKNTLEPEDVGPANQFYTPHWVVRMLTDNSLGKLYLEATGQESEVPKPEALSPDERKERLVTPEDSPTVPELCTYLIPDEEGGDAPGFEHPSELRVIDPACGSGHFLLYAFDILERIWWTETDLDRDEIPAKVLEHNLYGVDIDLRSCQLSAFNLYLKARTRAEKEDGQFEMPNVDIVCADARVAEVEEGGEVLDEITGEESDLREALHDIIDTFQHTEALGSLLNVSGTLEDVFESGQTGLSDWSDSTHQSLNSFLKALREAVDERTSDSFGEQNLRSFLNLLVVLTQEYDVALMNPPYGMRGRMPDGVKSYVSDHYKYYQEYYINFFEICERLSKSDGRVGMLVPWSFMFRKVFENFRVDFVGDDRSFDFLAEFGYDVLDNATVGTVGTVVRTNPNDSDKGQFIRLHDVAKAEKEETFLSAAFVDEFDGEIRRRYSRGADELSIVPGAPISYWVPKELRELYNAETVLDADNAGLENKNSIGSVKQGLASGDDSRFLPQFWEIKESNVEFSPVSNGGQDTWVLPKNTQSINWENNGKEVKRYSGSYIRSPHLYFSEGITFNRRKRSGRHFGYMHPESVFTESGTAIFPEDSSPWPFVSYLNSRLVTYLKLAQTFERKWEIGTVSRLPVPDMFFDSKDDLAESARLQIGNVLARRSTEFTSPHFSGTLAAQMLGYGNPNPPNHPHRTLLETIDLPTPPEKDPTTTIQELARSGEKYLQRLNRELERSAQETDRLLFDRLDLDDDLRREILQEVEIRTIDDPLTEWNRDGTEPTIEDDPSVSPSKLAKNLLLQFSMDIVRESDDGIVPLSKISGEEDILTRFETKFKQVWGEHATDRLAEADEILGNQSAADEAYPNLRAWIEDDLFKYHISKLDKSPILWLFSTERLVSDSVGEGFSCLIDYHQLDASIFDRLQNQYLEPRRTHLRERRAAANSRRNDESLSTSEHADAAEEYEWCESGLEQLSLFEEQLGKLAESNPREWPDENQERAAEAAERVPKFREQTASCLNDLEDLAELEGTDMEDLFSPSFYETVQKNKDEWIDALDDLQTAFESYAEDGSKPVEAHLYDLFEYYDDLIGSSHYASNGILFMTYYFDQFEDTGQAQIGDAGDTEQQKLLSKLAANLDEYTQLANEISEDCDAVAADIPNDWEERALSEVTTTGYQPVHKHGVAINITPLAEKDIVPEIVEDKVL